MVPHLNTEMQDLLLHQWIPHLGYKLLELYHR